MPGSSPKWPIAIGILAILVAIGFIICKAPDAEQQPSTSTNAGARPSSQGSQPSSSLAPASRSAVEQPLTSDDPGAPRRRWLTGSVYSAGSGQPLLACVKCGDQVIVTNSVEGSFTIEALVNSIGVYSRGYTARTITLERSQLTTGSDIVDLGAIAMQSERSIVVTVTDEARLPIANASVEAIQRAEGNEATFRVIGHTDASGRLTTAIEESMLVVATLEDRCTDISVIDAETKSLVLQLPGATARSIGVCNTEGAPLGGVPLRLTEQDGNYKLMFPLATGPDGRITHALPRSRYRITSPEHSAMTISTLGERSGPPQSHTPIVVDSRQSEGVTWLAIDPARRAVLHVFDASSGAPIVSADLWIQSLEQIGSRGSQWIDLPVRIHSKSSAGEHGIGSLAPSGANPDLVRLVVAASGFKQSYVHPFPVAIEAGKPLQLALEVCPKRTIRLLGAASSPIEGRWQLFEGRSMTSVGRRLMASILFPNGELGPFLWGGGDVTVVTPSGLELATIPARSLDGVERCDMDMPMIGGIDVPLGDSNDPLVAADYVVRRFPGEPIYGRLIGHTLQFRGLFPGTYYVGPASTIRGFLPHRGVPPDVARVSIEGTQANNIQQVSVPVKR